MNLPTLHLRKRDTEGSHGEGRKSNGVLSSWKGSERMSVLYQWNRRAGEGWAFLNECKREQRALGKDIGP